MIKRFCSGVVALALISTGTSLAEAEPFPVLVNECATGTSGWIELLNRGPTALDLANDSTVCWQVDDSDGGGAPKTISDGNTIHPDGSTICATYGRKANCAIIGPGERVRIAYAFVNAKTKDQCRVMTAPRTGTVCGADAVDVGVGFTTASQVAGQCFGRAPDGATPVVSPIPCSPGAPNNACTVGAPCDDGNPCVAGRVYDAECTCTGGTPLTGSSCGDGQTCQYGACMTAGATTPSIGPIGTNGLILAGTIVTPDTVLEGEVLVLGEDIVCVAPSCMANPAAASATVVRTNGLIFPGLIDTHNHILFDVFDETDWAPTAADDFQDHDDWPRNKKYSALVAAKHYLSGELGSPINLTCEAEKYGELKALIAGTTSIIGATAGSRTCFGSLARTIDTSANGLGTDRVQSLTIFPKSATDAEKICANLRDGGKTDGFLIHIGEGVNDTAHKEFDKLYSAPTTPGCLFTRRSTIVHGTSLEDADFGRMQESGMSLVWSPKSNVFLYGHDTDLSKTTKVPLALKRGITVALAPDWSIGGSQNILDELRFADRVDNAQWNNTISPQMLVSMVTRNPAKILGLGTTLGRVAPGYKADLTVVSGDTNTPYESLLAATPKNVRLVLVGGKVLYGDAALKSLGQISSECESLDICGSPKFVCVVAPGATAVNKFGQRLGEIRSSLENALKDYDDLKLSQWTFSPIAPLYRCP